MILKFSGAFLILISGSILGWIIAEQYTKRVQQLQELQMAIKVLDTEISYSSTFLPEALIHAGEKSTYPISFIFKETGKNMLNNRELIFSDIWIKILEENFYYNSLNNSDIKLLKNWGKQLGASHLKDQEKINKIILQQLKQNELIAREEAREKVKLFRYSGLLLSLLLIIVFY